MIEVVDFISLSLDSHIKVLNYRNSDAVRMQMNNHEIIELENHLKFVEKLKENSDNKYFLVTETDINEDIGVIYLNKLTSSKVFLGIYANLFCNVKGKGNILMKELEKLAFYIHNLPKLYLEVKIDNVKAIKLYQNLEYKFCNDTKPSFNNLLVMYKCNPYL